MSTPKGNGPPGRIERVRRREAGKLVRECRQMTDDSR
jgi:hypothetical protein